MLQSLLDTPVPSLEALSQPLTPNTRRYFDGFGEDQTGAKFRSRDGNANLLHFDPDPTGRDGEAQAATDTMVEDLINFDLDDSLRQGASIVPFHQQRDPMARLYNHLATHSPVCSVTVPPITPNSNFDISRARTCARMPQPGPFGPNKAGGASSLAPRRKLCCFRCFYNGLSCDNATKCQHCSTWEECVRAECHFYHKKGGCLARHCRGVHDEEGYKVTTRAPPWISKNWN